MSASGSISIDRIVQGPAHKRTVDGWRRIADNRYSAALAGVRTLASKAGGTLKRNADSKLS